MWARLAVMVSAQHSIAPLKPEARTHKVNFLLMREYRAAWLMEIHGEESRIYSPVPCFPHFRETSHRSCLLSNSVEVVHSLFFPLLTVAQHRATSLQPAASHFSPARSQMLVKLLSGSRYLSLMTLDLCRLGQQPWRPSVTR